MGESVSDLERVFNWRDLGGLPVADGGRVRNGVLFRSATPQQATAADVDYMRSLGLRRIFDLRFPKESASEGDGVVAKTEVEIVKLPFRVPRPETAAAAVPDQRAEPLGAFYVDMISLSTDPIARGVRLVAGDGLPTLFHCAAGKDRTGVFAALILSAIGVQDADVVADYVRTNEASQAIRSQLQTLPFYARGHDDREPVRDMVDGGVMASFLSGLEEKFGSARGYLSEAGVAADELELLRERLVVG